LGSRGEPGGASFASASLIIKLGGRALEAPGALAACADAIREAAASGRATLVVHGGGAEVSAWCERAGVTPRFADGLRVTDADTLEIAAAVLAGLANKRLVAALRARGVDAVGVSVLDGGIVRARRHADAAVLGEVGEVAAVDVSLLVTLLAAGRVPVLASLGDDGHGALLNLNADDVAAAIAGALPAGDLVLLSDTPGLVLDGHVVHSLSADALAGTLARPDVTGGMRPKLRAAGVAIAGGVQRVHIAAWQGPATLRTLLDGTAVATTLHASVATTASPASPASHEESHA
jgi:acetylglutamate kinase